MRYWIIAKHLVFARWETLSRFGLAALVLYINILHTLYMCRALKIFVLLSFFLTSVNWSLPVSAQGILMPKPGVRVSLSPQFNPPLLKGIKVDSKNPFHFEFILDKGEHQAKDLKEESQKLIKYFLASITTPENDLWVNLSPYEKERIIPAAFGQTEMGRDLLAQDYLLKQITASLMYPEDEVGKKFWKRIYDEAAKKYGTTNIPVNTFNKVWIVPEYAQVYEHDNTAFVVKADLKVMLDSDYLAGERNRVVSTGPVPAAPSQSSELEKLALPVERAPASGPPVPMSNKTNDELSKNIIRNIILPELTKEVNEGKNFASLRQVYNSLILANWYKQKIKDSILAKAYAGKNKVNGLSSTNASTRDPETIYKQYLQAFKKGAVNLIKEEIDSVSKQPIARKYFSGGFAMNRAMTVTQITRQIKDVMSSLVLTGLMALSVNLSPIQAADTSSRMTPQLQDQIEINKDIQKALDTYFSKERQDELLRKAPFLFDVKGILKGAHKDKLIAFIRNLPPLKGDEGENELMTFRMYHMGLIALYASYFPIDQNKFVALFIDTIQEPEIIESKDIDANYHYRYTRSMFSSATGVKLVGVLSHEIAHNYFYLADPDEEANIVIAEFTADVIAVAVMHDLYGPSYVQDFLRVRRFYFKAPPTKGAEVLLLNGIDRKHFSYGKSLRVMDSHVWAARFMFDIFARYDGKLDYQRLAQALFTLDQRTKKIGNKDGLVKISASNKLVDLSPFFIELLRLIESNPNLTLPIIELVVDPDTSAILINPQIKKSNFISALIPDFAASRPSLPVIKKVDQPRTSVEKGLEEKDLAMSSPQTIKYGNAVYTKINDTGNQGVVYISEDRKTAIKVFNKLGNVKQEHLDTLLIMAKELKRNRPKQFGQIYWTVNISSNQAGFPQQGILMDWVEGPTLGQHIRQLSIEGSRTAQLEIQQLKEEADEVLDWIDEVTERFADRRALFTRPEDYENFIYTPQGIVNIDPISMSFILNYPIPLRYLSEIQETIRQFKKTFPNIAYSYGSYQEATQSLFEYISARSGKNVLGYIDLFPNDQVGMIATDGVEIPASHAIVYDNMNAHELPTGSPWKFIFRVNEKGDINFELSPDKAEIDKNKAQFEVIKALIQDLTNRLKRKITITMPDRMMLNQGNLELVPDAAMKVADLGGIDLTAGRLNVDVKGDKAQSSIVFDATTLRSLEINGLFIKDIEIKPMPNLLQFLGVETPLVSPSQ